MNKGYAIEKIEIVSFGKLKNVVIVPEEHINLISLPNEAGKSTLAAFLKYIFYGFTGTKKQSVAENEKLRYMPWDGSAAKGAVTLRADGKRYRIERRTLGKEEDLTVTDTESGEAALQGQIPGRVLFGVGEDTFVKTLFVGSVGETKNGDATLAESLRNLLFSADDKTNADKAMKKLKDSRAYLKNMQYRGVIPGLEEKCKKLESALERANDIHSQLTSARVSLCDKRELLSGADEDLKKLATELENLSCYEAGQKLEAIREAERVHAEAQEKYESARSVLGGDTTPETMLIDTLADDNANLTLANRRISELSDELAAEEGRLAEIKRSSPFFETSPDAAVKTAKTHRLSCFVLLALGAVLAVLGLVVLIMKKHPAAWGCAFGFAAVALIASAVFALKGKSYAGSLGFSGAGELIKAADSFAVIRERARSVEARVDSLNRRYSEEVAESKRLSESVGRRVNEFMPSASEDEGYSASIRKIYAAASEIGACKAEWLHAAAMCKKLTEGEDIDALAQKAARATTPPRSRDEAERELNFTRARLNSLHNAVTELEHKTASLEAQSESPAVIAAELEIAERKLDEANAQYRALTLAMEVLEDACNYMKATVSPKLAQLTGGYLSTASGGRYDSVSLSANLEMTYDDDGMEHNADHLSDGARDMAYISMRFALVELIYDDNRPFIIIDDSFCHLDDGRLAFMLGLIKELAEKQQIFMFSCRDRERTILDSLDAPYALLTFGEGSC